MYLPPASYCSLLLSSNASEPTVKQIQAGLATFGLVAISVVLLTRAFSLQSTSLIADVTLRILRGLVVYGLVLWVIGIFDDNLYRWVLANPFDALPRSGFPRSEICVFASRFISKMSKMEGAAQ